MRGACKPDASETGKDSVRRHSARLIALNAGLGAGAGARLARLRRISGCRGRAARASRRTAARDWRWRCVGPYRRRARPNRTSRDCRETHERALAGRRRQRPFLFQPMNVHAAHELAVHRRTPRPRAARMAAPFICRHDEHIETRLERPDVEARTALRVVGQASRDPRARRRSLNHAAAPQVSSLTRHVLGRRRRHNLRHRFAHSRHELVRPAKPRCVTNAALCDQGIANDCLHH